MSEFDPTPSNKQSYTMYYVYMLRNRNTKEFYYGYTNNLSRRFSEHNQKRKWEIIYYEAYRSELDARNREKRLKQFAQALTVLKGRLKESLK